MTPGEVKGYARQAMKRKELSPQEKTAISLLIDGMEAMLAVAPIVSKANKELVNVKDSNDVIGVVDARDGADPNTGWKGDYVLPNREGDE
jgi:hypothetical protein